MKRLWPLLFILLSTIPLACTQGPPSDDAFNLPPLYISCNPGKTFGCQTTNIGKTFYVGLTTDTSVDCEMELFNVVLGQFHLYFDFNGKSTTTFSGEMEGAILQWYDMQKRKSYYMQNKNYKACAFIDLNDNGIIDPLEPFGSLIFTPADNFPTIIDWTQ